MGVHRVSNLFLKICNVFFLVTVLKTFMLYNPLWHDKPVLPPVFIYMTSYYICMPSYMHALVYA